MTEMKMMMKTIKPQKLLFYFPYASLSSAESLFSSATSGFSCEESKVGRTAVCSGGGGVCAVPLLASLISSPALHPYLKAPVNESQPRLKN